MAGATVERVVTITTRNRISAFSTKQNITTTITIDGVIAVVAKYLINFISAIKRIACIGSVLHVTNINNILRINDIAIFKFQLVLLIFTDQPGINLNKVICRCLCIFYQQVGSNQRQIQCTYIFSKFKIKGFFNISLYWIRNLVLTKTGSKNILISTLATIQNIVASTTNDYICGRCTSNGIVTSTGINTVNTNKSYG